MKTSDLLLLMGAIYSAQAGPDLLNAILGMACATAGLYMTVKEARQDKK